MVAVGFLLLICLPLLAIVLWALSSRAGYEREAERQRRQNAERERVEACGEVVLFFANHLGYIARDLISRGELADLIDSGIAAPDLASIIARRVEATEGLVLGYHSFGEHGIEVKLTAEHRARHLYVVGKSGSGKTNLLRNLIMQDIGAGCGIGVIAPEQELLTEELLPYVPDDRLDDIIYCDPADPHCPVSFNPLHLDEGEDLDTKVDEVFTVLQRLIGHGSGPRMDELLRHTLYVLVARPGATLLDVEPLLDRTDASFRQEVIRTSADPQLVRFWRDVYPSFPKDAHLPITNRLGRFTRSKAVRNVLCRPQGSLNFRQAMDEGRIMLFNLSDGILGEQSAQLLGQLVVAKFQLAVMSRAAMPKSSRRDFHLYLDEFQTFTGASATSYERMLSRARKYRLSLTLAHQQTAQLPSDLLKEIMGNVSTSICFLVSREDAMKFSKEFVTLYDGEVVRIPEEEILRLKVGQAWCKIGQHAFLMHTYLADQRPDHHRGRLVIEHARRNYLRLNPAPVLASEKDDTGLAGVRVTEEFVMTGEDARSTPRVTPVTLEAERVGDPLDELDPANLFDE